MMTIITHSQRFRSILPVIPIHPVIALLVPVILLSFSFPYWIYHFDHTAALPDPGIWSLILLSMAVFLLILLLCWYIFTKSWEWLQLPESKMMLSQFKHLELWQQFLLYWASFALLLLAAIGCLVAVF